MRKGHLFALFVVHAAIILYLAAQTPIAPHEAKLFFSEKPNIVTTLMHLGYTLVPTAFGVRVLFIVLAFNAIIGYYALVSRYFTHKASVYLSLAIFMFLPGIVIAGSMANIAILVLNLLILFVLLYKSKHLWTAVVIMVILLFIHRAAGVFFFAIFLYAMAHRQKPLAIISISLFITHLLFSGGIEVGGYPEGHFLDIFGLYATVFSPLLFLYFFYTLYRRLLRSERPLEWYIAFVAFIASLLLSLRQKVYITDFAPYVMIATHLMVETFQNSVRVRLPEFRKKYYIGFVLAMVLFAVTIAVALSAGLSYRLSGRSHNHFASRIYEPYELAQSLKEKGVVCYDTRGKKVYQLRFYGIEPCRSLH